MSLGALQEFLAEASEFVAVIGRRCFRFSRSEVEFGRSTHGIRIVLGEALIEVGAECRAARSSHRLRLRERGNSLILLKPSRRNELWLRRQQFRWMVEDRVGQRWECVRSGYLHGAAAGSPILRLVLRRRGRLFAALAVSEEDEVRAESLLSHLFTFWRQCEATGRHPLRIEAGLLFVSPALGEQASCLLPDLQGPVHVYSLPDLTPCVQETWVPVTLLWPPAGSFLDLQKLHQELELPPEVRSSVRPGSLWSFEYLGVPFAVLDVNRRQWTFPRLKEQGVPDGPSVRKQVLVESLAVRSIRRARTVRRNDPLYQLYSERWLEDLILRDPKGIESEFRMQPIYSQVPAYVTRRRVVDLVAVTEGERLAVIEVKTQKSPDILLQGLAYWRIVWQAQLQDAFRANGYFRGLRLSDEPPLLYCVTPLLGLHSAVRELATRIRPPV